LDIRVIQAEVEEAFYVCELRNAAYLRALMSLLPGCGGPALVMREQRLSLKLCGTTRVLPTSGMKARQEKEQRK